MPKYALIVNVNGDSVWEHEFEAKNLDSAEQSCEGIVTVNVVELDENGMEKDAAI